MPKSPQICTRVIINLEDFIFAIIAEEILILARKYLEYSYIVATLSVANA